MLYLLFINHLTTESICRKTYETNCLEFLSILNTVMKDLVIDKIEIDRMGKITLPYNNISGNIFIL